MPMMWDEKCIENGIQRSVQWFGDALEALEETLAHNMLWYILSFILCSYSFGLRSLPTIANYCIADYFSIIHLLTLSTCIAILLHCDTTVHCSEAAQHPKHTNQWQRVVKSGSRDAIRPLSQRWIIALPERMARGSRDLMPLQMRFLIPTRSESDRFWNF